MTQDELVDELNIHADTRPRMMALYDQLADMKDENYMVMVTLLQAAFWTGVEAAHDSEFNTAISSYADKL